MGDKGDGEDLKRVNSYTWPSGHVAHLTEGQLGALDRFKKLSQQKGYYDPGNDKTPPSHDDETLLRYLRARKFIPQEAFGQFKDTEDWRKENQLDKLYETIDVAEYDGTRKLYPQWTGRRDKRGIPLYVYEIKSVDAKDVSAHSSSKDSKKQSTNSKVPWKMLKLFALYENLCRFVLPLCSAIPDRPNGETPISQSNNIVDLKGVGITKLFNLRNHMSDASQLATSHYPETLDRIFVVGAPSFFPTVWGWAKSWFDPITVAKIFILSESDMASTLAKYVDLENIPKKYGGTLDWQFGDLPYLEPAIANSLRWKENIEQKGHKTLPIGPIKWQYDKDGDLVATAIGTENGKPRSHVIGKLHTEGVAKLALSPGRAENNALFQTTSAQIPAVNDKSPATAAMTESSQPSMNGAIAQSSNTANPTSKSPATTESGSVGREGTSSSRFVQQSGTHAEGQQGHATPEVRVDGQGEKQGIMEPNTVGQAPKEHPMKIPEIEEPQPSYVEQAKGAAGQALETAKQVPAMVMGAVGMGGEKQENKEPAAKKEDPAVDGMEAGRVEEFLRSQTMSRPESNIPAQ